MKPVIDIIHERHSVRNYSLEIIEKEKLQLLVEYINSNSCGPFGNRIRFQLVDGTVYDHDELKKLGTYGLIKGARMFIAGAISRDEYALEDFGYCMEKIILFSTGIGLATCWLGGTLNRSSFADKLKIKENEMIPAVTALGYADKKNTVKGRIASMTMRSGTRKSPEELFFDKRYGCPLDLNESVDIAVILDCVRWSPSAGNMQPWRIIRDDDSYHFYMKENRSYNNSTSFQRLIPGKGNKLQNIDMGIAMAHFELTAAELGLTGKWQVLETLQNEDSLTYTATWSKEHN